MTSPVTSHTMWLCFWTSHMNNQSKCQLGDYGEETRQQATSLWAHFKLLYVYSSLQWPI